MKRLGIVTKRRSVTKTSSRWSSPRTPPPKAGWYQVLAPDNRWDGQPCWRLWRNGAWWKQCESPTFVAYASESARFRWRGPAKPARLTYAQVVALAGGASDHCGDGGKGGCA